MFDASTGRTFPPAGAKVSVPLIEPSVNLMWIHLSVSAVEAVPIRHALRWNGVQQHLWIVRKEDSTNSLATLESHAIVPQAPLLWIRLTFIVLLLFFDDDALFHLRDMRCFGS